MVVFCSGSIVFVMVDWRWQFKAREHVGASLGCMRSSNLPDNHERQSEAFVYEAWSRYDLPAWLVSIDALHFLSSHPSPFLLCFPLGRKWEKETNERVWRESVPDHGGLLENQRKGEFVFQRRHSVRLKTRRVKGDVNREGKNKGKRYEEQRVSGEKKGEILKLNPPGRWIIRLFAGFWIRGMFKAFKTN